VITITIGSPASMTPQQARHFNAAIEKAICAPIETSVGGGCAQQQHETRTPMRAAVNVQDLRESCRFYPAGWVPSGLSRYNIASPGRRIALTRSSPGVCAPAPCVH
jgi:hypothetical protein